MKEDPNVINFVRQYSNLQPAELEESISNTSLFALPIPKPEDPP